MFDLQDKYGPLPDLTWKDVFEAVGELKDGPAKQAWSSVLVISQEAGDDPASPFWMIRRFTKAAEDAAKAMGDGYKNARMAGTKLSQALSTEARLLKIQAEREYEELQLLRQERAAEKQIVRDVPVRRDQDYNGRWESNPYLMED